MYCPSCGALVGENDNNCAQCGALLKSTPPATETVAEPAVESVVEPAVEPTQNQTQYDQPDYNQPVYQQPDYQQNGYSQPDYQPVYQDPYQDPYQQPIPVQPPVDPGKNFGIASLVLGIVGFITCCCPFASALSAISPICIIVGIVLGFIARSKSKAVNIKNNLALAGIIFSIVPIILFIICVAVVTGVIIATDGEILNEVARALEEAGMGEYTYMFEEMLGEFENMI